MMTRFLAILVAGWVAATAASAQTLDDYSGDWQGTLSVGAASLPLILHVTPEAVPPATLDSPAQGAFGIPASEAGTEDGALMVTFAAIGASYEGRLGDDGDSIDGTFRQGGQVIDLDLSRADPDAAAAAPAPRPQEPQLPLPYPAEEVTITEPGSGVTLAGTLTLPTGEGPFPAVILLSGSGPQDRDEALMGHRPFFVLSDRLTRAGIAVLRYDDRGTGGSNGIFAASTTRDFAADAAAALKWLEARGDISDAGYLGHSEGGLVAPLAAAEKDADPAFIVALAGPFVPMKRILVQQAEDILDNANANQAERLSALVTQERILNASLNADTPESACAELDGSLADLKGNDRASAEQFLCSAWGFELLRLDPFALYKAYDGPVLALFGEKDLQVSADLNAPAARRLDTVDVETVENANHLFQTADTGALSEYAEIEETMQEGVMARIAAWIIVQTAP